jgi:hypothetical protein
MLEYIEAISFKWKLFKFFPLLKTQTSQKLLDIKGILAGFV